MFIVARGGQTYARLRFHTGPGGDILLPVEICYRQNFPGSNPSAWYEEYKRCVEMLPPIRHYERIIMPDRSAPERVQLSVEEWVEQEEEPIKEERELIYEYA